MLILRHAESEWNRMFGATRIDAGIFDPGVTREGAEAARASAEKLRAVPLTQIVSSPYRRTLQTASILADVLQLPVSVEPLVRERCAFSATRAPVPGISPASGPTWISSISMSGGGARRSRVWSRCASAPCCFSSEPACFGSRRRC